MMNKIFYKHYVFLEQINKLIEENLLKFNNVNIIINVNNNINNCIIDCEVIFKKDKWKNNLQSLKEYTDNEYYVVEYQCHSLDFVVQRNAIKEIIGSNFTTIFLQV